MKGIKVSFVIMVLLQLTMLDLGLFLYWEPWVIDVIAFGICVAYTVVLAALVYWANKEVFGKE